MMIRPLGVFLLTLPVAAAVPAVSALAQSNRTAPPAYYRSAPPPGAYDDRLPAPGLWADDDSDDQLVRRLQRGAQVSQMPPQGQGPVSYTHLRAHETGRNLVCRLLLEKKKKQ